MRAELIESRKLALPNGAIVEIRVWRLRLPQPQPQPTQERPHGLKYSLFYGRAGERIVGYDNELGKGDHRHYREREESYTFVSFRQLVLDFWSDVRREIENERSEA